MLTTTQYMYVDMWGNGQGQITTVLGVYIKESGVYQLYKL